MRKLFVSAISICLCLSLTMHPLFAETSSLDDLESKVEALEQQVSELTKAVYAILGNPAENTESGATSESVSHMDSDNGRRIILNETVNVPDWGAITVLRSEFTDTIKAANPAEDSLKIYAGSGKVFYRAEIAFSAFHEDISISEALKCRLLVDGTVYEDGWLLLASQNMNGTIHNNEYDDFTEMREYRYLFNTFGSGIKVNMTENYPSNSALFIYAVEIPAEIAEGVNGENIILQIEANGTDLSYRV